MFYAATDPLVPAKPTNLSQDSETESESGAELPADLVRLTLEFRTGRLLCD